MPVVHVRSLACDAARADVMLAAVVDAVAAAVPCGPADVWCTFAELGRECTGRQVRTGEGRIAYVDLHLRGRPGDDGVEGRALAAACRAVADGLEISVADVWGAVHPVRPGAVFAGGTLLS